MDPQAMLMVQAAASVFGGILILVALFVLWNKSQSPWLLIALAGEGVSLLFRIGFSLAPAALSAIPMIPLVWSITGLLVAAGLLGYAIDESKRRV